MFSGSGWVKLPCMLQVPCIYATLEKRSFKRMRCAILAAMGLCIFIYTVAASELTENDVFDVACLRSMAALTLRRAEVVALSGLHIAELQGDARLHQDEGKLPRFLVLSESETLARKPRKTDFLCIMGLGKERCRV